MPCAVCKSGCSVPGDTGGTEDCLPIDEMVLLHSLARSGRGTYRTVRVRLHRAIVTEFLPIHAHALALSSSASFPSGVVVVHMEKQRALVFTSSACKPVHVGCAVELLRMRLSVGVAIGKGNKDVFAIQVGKRVAPLLRLI